MSHQPPSRSSQKPPASPQPALPGQASHLAETCDQAADAKAAELVRILDQHLAELKAGKAPTPAELMARHPELASQLEACLAGLEFIHSAESAPGRAQRLGDFRIVREVGRGGMGAVFEAEQLSLGRRVALKILRFGGVSDPEAIERFKREAETVAKLHHTNIVPIFAVGSEHGVNYYAMQFIDGRSLAEVLAEKKQPLPPDQVAEWGLQAAEALTHAHQRGVIHRDVKPSNLLLDKENRLWLTDFGLARRMDDVTLSMTGAILGTPRYMSPEQAAASSKRVDHRSDLFSLGATLYELLTGKPAFAGETPHDVIQQILTGEPTPMRKLNASMPRDLETIIMKCLAKEPGQRYSAARDLADDLRAFLDGRPIRARRASLVELAIRWVKMQQRSVKLAAAAAAITLLVTVAGIFGWNRYDAWRQASLKFNAATPPLVAEIFNRQGELVRVETAPMQNAANFPAGDYCVRVTAEGKLSETFDVHLPRGQGLVHTLDLSDQLLWTPRDLDRAFDVVDCGSEQGLVLWNEKGIGLRKNREPLGWTRELKTMQLPKPEEVPGFRWPWHQGSGEHSGYGAFDTRPWVAPRTVDIDGHGTGDLIVAGRHQAWLMALSGDEGTIRWFAPRGHDLAQPAPQSGNYFGSGVKSAILGTPILSPDVNGDGIPDVIATMADIGLKPALFQNRFVAKCWVEAISGKSGEKIWSFDIPDEWFDLPVGLEVPYDLRWFAGTSGGYMSGGGNNMTMGRHRARGGTHSERTGPHAYRPAAVSLVNLANASCLAIVAGTQFVALDPATGKPVDEPINLGARPGRDCQWGDVDGDGTSDLVLVEEVGGTGFPAAATARLVVWSPAKRKQVWAKRLNAAWPGWPMPTVEAPQWPLVVDLNGDKKCEIVVPDGRSGRVGGSGGTINFSEIPWGVLTVLAGETGQPLWTRRLVSMDQQVDHFLAGPDLDQDGSRELYVVTLEGTEFRVHVDAFSGKTGKTLWTVSQTSPPDYNSSREFCLRPPQWWQAGQDGWPQLVVQLSGSEMDGGRSVIWTFSAGTGRLVHFGQNITAVRPADIDGDATEDLLVYHSKTPRAFDLGGQLHCVRGVASEKWALLGDLGEPAADFDGDGACDLLVGWPSATLTATSGATGSVLWNSRLADPARQYHVRLAAPHGSGDLDGDGIDDLLGWIYTSHYRHRGNPFFAVSGKTGRKLWTAAEISVQLLSGVIAAEAHDLDGDGKPEVLWLAAVDYEYPLRESISSHEAQLWLFVTSGQTGKLRWSHPLSSPYGQLPASPMQINVPGATVSPSVGDVNGDGTSDLLVPVLLSDGRSFETHALSGKDGKVLWSRPYPADTSQQASLENWTPPTICDLDGDSRSEVVVVELTSADASGKPSRPLQRVVAVHGNDGREIWSWTAETPPDYWYTGAGQSKAELMRPRVLRTGGKERRIAVLLPGNEGKVLVFEANGRRHERKANFQTSTAGIWPCDADGDSVDELAFLDNSFVCVAPADKLEAPLWTRSLDTAGSQRILGILPRADKQPPVVAVALDAADNSVFGFDAATGRRLWSCPGLISRDAGDGTYQVPQHVALLDGGAKGPPHVYYHYGSVSRCRQAALTSESEPTTPPAFTRTVAHDQFTRHGVSMAAANLAGGNDDRWDRDLPWIERQASVSEIVTLILWSLGFAALLVVLPSAFVARLVILRRFNLRMLLALPVVAGLFLTAALIKSPIERDFLGPPPRFWFALSFAPVVVAIGLLVWWLAKGQWRRVLLWLGVTLVVSVICASYLLWIASDRSPLLPEEHYNWQGWYVIWFIGAYLTAWIMVVILPIKYLALAAWQRIRGKPQGASSQPETIVAAAPTKAAGKV